MMQVLSGVPHTAAVWVLRAHSLHTITTTALRIFTHACKQRCRKQASVDETVAALRSEGLEVAGCACHVGSDEQRRALVAACVKVRGDLFRV